MKLDGRQVFVTETATKYGKRLRGYVASRVRNAADVSDLVQEVFLRLLRMDRHEPIRNAEACLMTIAARMLHQHQVRRAAASASPGSDIGAFGAEKRQPREEGDAGHFLQIDLKLASEIPLPHHRPHLGSP